MLTVDRKIPWGRPAEDVIARRRERKGHNMHRQRLKDSRAQVDRDVPDTTSMKHLRNRAKKRQMADDRLQQIANENRKLMEKMAAIMRKKGPGAKSPTKPKARGEAIYNAPPLNAVTRRNEQSRIARENRAILARIRNGKNTKSHYDHGELGKEEKRRLRYIKNISKSYQRDIRVKKATARKNMMMASVPTMGGLNQGSIDSAGMGGGYGSVLEGGMSLSLHTAKQIREDVATQRGMPLPDIISRRPGETHRPVMKMPQVGVPGKSVGGGSVASQSKFVLSHKGAGATGNASIGSQGSFGFGQEFGNSLTDAGAGSPGPEFGEAGAAFAGGEWGDYDYNSADGGNFPGRGYSAANSNRPNTTAQSGRPTTTAQSERSQESKS
ncbi:hypothetical protein TL16_g12000 [Triparma laevis f. inornata]|uniref:Uncharacterized protein n=1 Tax=Triparma laevis f. inornata TaxID=1714386 RepID=A0A9W7BPW7_9STRA|nr:hypothetical protein TL16_g12000 [Triparma laevis f. inornata]